MSIGDDIKKHRESKGMTQEESGEAKKTEDAYRAYEELILSGYRQIQMALNDLRILFMQDDDHEMAKKLADVSSSMASAFEMGRYNEVCGGLDVAVWERDVERTVQLMREMLDSVDTIGDFTRSDLFRHMTIAPDGSEYSADLKRSF